MVLYKAAKAFAAFIYLFQIVTWSSTKKHVFYFVMKCSTSRSGGLEG